jgi:hypothetical protein
MALGPIATEPSLCSLFNSALTQPSVTEREIKLFTKATQIRLRALSARLAAEFNISPGRWKHVWLVAIVPPKRWGKMD